MILRHTFLLTCICLSGILLMECQRGQQTPMQGTPPTSDTRATSGATPTLKQWPPDTMYIAFRPARKIVVRAAWKSDTARVAAAGEVYYGLVPAQWQSEQTHEKGTKYVVKSTGTPQWPPDTTTLSSFVKEFNSEDRWLTVAKQDTMP